MSEAGPLREPASLLESPAASYAGRTRYTQLEFEALLGNVSIGIAFTRERRFFLCNHRFAELFGYAPDELIGQPGELVYPSEASFVALGELAVPLLAEGRQLDVEWEMRRKDGATFLARMIAKAIDAANPQQGTVWIVEDITEKRRQSDAVARLLREQEAILGSASVGIVFVKDRRIVRCNRRYEEMYGYSGGELAGKPTAVLYPTLAEHARAAEVYDALSRGETGRRIELHRRKDGSTFWTRADGRAVDAGDAAQGSVWIVEDITEQRRADEAMERLVREQAEAEERIQRVLAEQELILDNASVGIAFVRRGAIERCNRFLEEMVGAAPGELPGQSSATLFASEEEWSEAVRIAYGSTAPGETHESEWRFRRRDGATFLCRTRGRRIDVGDAEQEWIWSFEDVTAEREAERRVQRALAQQELILDNATIGIAFVRNRTYQRCNRAFEQIFGYTAQELVGRSSEMIYADRAAWERAGACYEAMARGEAVTEERRYRRKDGSHLWCKVVGKAIDPARAHEGSIWIYDDVSAEHAAREALERAVEKRTAELQAANARLEVEVAERKQAESRAKHLADHDALTGLPNRRLLEDRLTQALALSYRNRKLTAVMFVDLDRFKTINDSLGHAVGDVLLKEVAVRLVRQLRIGDTVCRVGGDEFVVVLPEIRRASDAVQVAQKLIDQLSNPVRVDERELVVTPSIGIAVFPDDGRDAETLIRHADAAMYHAKEMGRANYQFFTAAMNQAASRRLALETDLRRALGRDELRVHYQRVVAAGSGRVAAHEALVRWQHPERGLVMPSEFIQVAEETGMILKLGEWVLREACRWATFIGVERGLPVAVNLSARQFNDPKLVDAVAAALRESGLPARLLELEITETTAMQHTDATLGTLNRLKALGVTLVIDDFGTGYSSLSYLKRFPVDKLKVDRNFIADVPGDADQCAIVGAIVALAHALEIEVVAEGVQSEEQCEFLRRCGCDYLQGDLLGAPLDAEAAADDYI